MDSTSASEVDTTPTKFLPTPTTLLVVSAVLVISAAGCMLGLALGDSENQPAEVIYAAVLAVCLLGLAGVARTASLRARAIREATHVLLSRPWNTLNYDDLLFRQTVEQLIALGALKEAELVVNMARTQR